MSISTGDLTQAVSYFDTAIRLNGNHEVSLYCHQGHMLTDSVSQQALLNFAIVVQDEARVELFDLAESRLRHLLALGLANERVFFQLGMLAMNSKRLVQAEDWFGRAVHMKPDFRSATFNLALLLSNTNRPLEALSHLERLAAHHPDHIKGLTLLCDILINNVQDMARAEVCYRRILSLEPANIQARHNLCVVLVERGLLDEAEHCLAKANDIAPHQHYIDRHLKIVRLRILRLRQAHQSIH